MAKKTVDISNFLNNDAPEIVLFGKTYTVKNDKTTVLLLNQMQRQIADGKIKADAKGTPDEKLLKLLLGDTAGEEVIKVLDGMTNYSDNERLVMYHVLALATGQSYEDMEARFQREQKKL